MVQKLEDVCTSLATENPILVLKANDVELRGIQELCSLRIVLNAFVADLESHGRWIVIGTIGIVHGNHTGLQTGAGGRHRLMQIVGEGGDPATARKMIADERNTMQWFH